MDICIERRMIGVAASDMCVHVFNIDLQVNPPSRPSLTSEITVSAVSGRFHPYTNRIQSQGLVSSMRQRRKHRCLY